jgi:hypothetical protein
MEKEDYLMRQINQLGRVLGKILANLMGFNNQGPVSEVLDEADVLFKTESGFDGMDFLSCPKDDFIKALRENQNWNTANLQLLVEILCVTAENSEKVGTEKLLVKTLYEKALIVYDEIETSESTFSLERQIKREEILSRIENS